MPWGWKGVGPVLVACNAVTNAQSKQRFVKKKIYIFLCLKKLQCTSLELILQTKRTLLVG